MEHSGAFSAGAGVLNGNSAKGVGSNGGAQVNLVGQRRIRRFGRLGGDVGSEAPVAIAEGDGAAGAIAGRRDGLCELTGNAVLILHQIEVDGLSMLGGADDAQGIARERASVELQTNVHILPGSRSETLSGSLRGVDAEGERHRAIILFQRRVHEAGTTLSLQQATTHGAVETLAILPHGAVAAEAPVELMSVGRLEAIHGPIAFEHLRLPLAGEVAEIGREIGRASCRERV